jgi:hypothetical protein
VYQIPENYTIVEELSKSGIDAVVRSNALPLNSKLVHNLKPQHDFPFGLLWQFTRFVAYSMKELQVLVMRLLDDGVRESLPERL